MHTDVAALLLLLVIGSAIAPVIAPRLGVPEAILQIAYGIVIGIFGIGHHGAPEEVLHLLAELGFILLMFGAGLEIDFSAIERGGRAGLLRGLGVAAGFSIVSLGLVVIFKLPVFYVVVLAATSVGLGVAVLREGGLLTAPVGQWVLLVGSIGEFITLISMTVFGVASRVGFSAQLFIDVGKLAALFVAGGVFLRYLRGWAWWHPGVFQRVFKTHDASEVGVRLALVICFIFTALAVVLGVEAILGSFIAGAVFRFVFREVHVLEHKMSALSSGFFIPIFFISVGVSFDLAQLSLPGLGKAGILAFLIVTARLLPSIFLVRGDVSPRDALGVALLLGAPLTLLVAIAELGGSLGILDEAAESAIVLLAIILSVVLPVAFKALFSEPRGSTA
ncbi:MAG: cation:proton antiporter [Deltaproteobacteria bacterium]|nr:cation:proton antiporter [Deltaproteobacteria bacterium]